MYLNLKYVVVFLLGFIHFARCDPALWTVNIPSVSSNTASIKVRVIIDGVEQTSGAVAGFNPDGYITAVQHSPSVIPTGVPNAGWYIFDISLKGDANEEHSIHFSADNVEDIILVPSYSFVVNDGSYIELIGTRKTYEIVSTGPPNEARLLDESECEAYANSRDPVASFTVHATGNVLGCTVNTDANTVKYTASSSSNSGCNFGGDKCVYNALIDNAIVLSPAANVDLLTLKRCDSTENSIAVIDDTNQNYGMVHSIGLTYQRSNLEAGRDPITYCQDQQFVTTISRDASATTSVTTLVAPSLQRSVVVHGINWVQCESQLLECAGSSDCYKLKIDLSAKEKNVDDTVWTNASLSDAFQHEGGANTDGMSVVHDLSPLNTGNVISLVGQCGIIPNCSISDPGINNHWYEHTSTEQDVVLRGTFQFVDVDSIAKISTAFSECPLGATTTYNGELKLGLKLGCEDRLGNDVALTTIDSDVTDENGVVQNCRSALTSSLVRITTDVYVNTKDPTGKAAAEGWEMKDIDFKFNRYEASLIGEPIKSKLISSDLIMQMRYDSVTQDWTCTRVSSRITGLPLFDQAVLDCDITDLTTTTYSSSKTGLTHGEAGTIMFDLQPLQMANMDAYEVEVIAMIQNLQLESRRLRTTYKLRSGGLVDEQVGFPTISGNVTTGDSGEQDKERNEHLEQMIVILIVIAVLLGLIAGGLFMCCRRRNTDMTTATLAIVEEKQKLIERPSSTSGPRLRPRFKNLRY